jgi:hypothetical protein
MWFRSIIKYFTKTPSVPLGRWKLLERESYIENRIDYANVDHCGPCSVQDLHELKKKININLPYKVKCND